MAEILAATEPIPDYLVTQLETAKQRSSLH